MDTYRTRDLNLAAFLATRGYAFVAAMDGGSVWFDFAPGARSEKEAFFRGEGDAVSARAYARSLTDLKARIGVLRGAR